MRIFLAVPLLACLLLSAVAEEKKGDAKGQALFNGKDLKGWNLIRSEERRVGKECRL